MSDQAKIIGVLRDRTAGLSDDERVRYIYNEAIDDAANFLRDLAPHNAAHAGTLLSAEREVRKLALAREETDDG